METLEMSPSSMLAFFETDKQQRSSFVMQIIEDLQEGRRNPLNLHLQVKCLEETVKMLTDKKAYPTTAEPYSQMLLEAAQKEGKEFTHHNAKFSIAESGVRYFYDKCGDNELNELVAQMEVLKEKIDEKQTFLRNLPIEGVEIRQGDELVRVYPAYKKSSSCVKVTLK